MDWKADPYTYQTLEACTNLTVPALIALKAYSPPSDLTNRFIDSPLRTAKYYRVRAEQGDRSELLVDPAIRERSCCGFLEFAADVLASRLGKLERCTIRT